MSFVKTALRWMLYGGFLLVAMIALAYIGQATQKTIPLETLTGLGQQLDDRSLTLAAVRVAILATFIALWPHIIAWRSNKLNWSPKTTAQMLQRRHSLIWIAIGAELVIGHDLWLAWVPQTGLVAIGFLVVRAAIYSAVFFYWPQLVAWNASRQSWADEKTQNMANKRLHLILYFLLAEMVLAHQLWLGWIGS